MKKMNLTVRECEKMDLSPEPQNAVSNCNKKYMENFQNILLPGKMPNMLKDYQPKVVQEFDKYLTPEELKKFVLKREKINAIIEYYSEKTNQNKSTIKKEIKKILNEVALDRNLCIIRTLGMCINSICKRICTGIYVNETNLRNIKNSIGKNPVLYLPSHRSYCDFILMSYICFHYDIEIPGIAAGMDFYSMFAMGTMLRKTGAFFMRRSFSNDDELYWDIFKEYIHALVTVYHIGIEFFIEGTRSRNFKALMPKIGLLSMTLQPLFMGEVPDITIVPVSVSYERLLEEQLFAYELLGVPKPKESTTGFLKALKIIDERYGRMYLDFGEPISVKKYFGNKLNRIKYASISPNFQKIEKDDLNIIKDLAFEVVYQQQKRIVITTFNLISLYFGYKSYLGQQISLEQLSNGVLLLKTIFEYLGTSIATEEKNIKMDIIETVEIHGKILRIPPAGGKIELVRSSFKKHVINPKQKLKGHLLNEYTMEMSIPALSLQLYINPCMFWLSIPSMMILAAMKLTIETGGRFQKDQFRIRMEELRTVFANEFVLVPARKEDDFQNSIDFLVHFKIFEIADRIRFNRNEISEILLSSIAPFLFCYFQLSQTILEEFAIKDFTEKELFVSNQKRVENLLLARAQYTHPYCLALDTLSVALLSFVQNSYVNKRKEDVYLYSCRQSELNNLRNMLLQYSQLLKFNFYENVSNILCKL